MQNTMACRGGQKAVAAKIATICWISN